MSSTITEILSVTISHSYFNGGICQNLAISPLSGTSTWLKRMNYTTRLYKNIFSIYNAFSNLSFKNTHTNDLYFYIISSDATFTNYTDIPFERIPNEMYFFTNSGQQSNLQASKSVSQTDRVLSTGLSFNYPVPQINNVKVVILDAHNNQIISTIVNGLTTDLVYLDLTEFGEGYYKMRIDNQQEIPFIATDGNQPNGTIGILRIDLALIQSQSLQLLPRRYTIDYSARAVYWQYQIIQDPNTQIIIIDMEIADDQGINYNGPTHQVVGRHKASVFVSPYVKLLQQKPNNPQTLKVKYKNPHTVRTSEKEIQMPFPDITSMHTTNSKANTINILTNNIVFI